METIKRDLNTDFAHGVVSSTLTLAGEGVESRPEMLDNIFAKVSKALYRVLIPHFNESAKLEERLPGKTVVEEQLKLELLGLTFTYDIKVELNVELDSPDKDGLRFFILEIMGPEVVSDAVGRIAVRLKGETIRNYYEEHPEAIPPFGDVDLSDLGPLGRVLAGFSRS